MTDVLFFVLTLAAALAIRHWVLCFTRVQGRSMLPTLRDGQWTFVTRWDYHFRPPRRGEIVICFFPGRRMKRLPFLRQMMVKRVIGLPGETVALENGRALIDGEPLAEPYLDDCYTRFKGSYPPVTLGEDEYFVLGDNRDASNDSRRVGPIGRRELVGHVHAR